MEKFLTMHELYALISGYRDLLVYNILPCGSILAAHFPTNHIHMNDKFGVTTMLIQSGGDIFYLKEPPHDSGTDYRFRCLVANDSSDCKLELFNGETPITLCLRQ